MRFVQVAVAVIVDVNQRVLLTRRAKNTHLAGLWEFPGGKLEPNENAEQALQRELGEELGITPTDYQPLIRIRHHYTDKSVQLEVFRVNAYDGEALGLEGQPLAWTPLQQIASYPLPEADKPIVTAIRLPNRYLITESDWLAPDHLAQRFAAALRAGERLFQLRIKQADAEQRFELATIAAQQCADFNARLMINADWQLTQRIGAAGVQLTSSQLADLNQRPLDSNYLVAASCHDLAQLEKAQAIGADFALLSPVKPTKSHPGVAGMGWQAFSEQVDQCNIPVYALGGMAAVDLDDAIAAGGQGVSGIRGLWPVG